MKGPAQTPVSAEQDATIRAMAGRLQSISEMMSATGLGRGVIRRYMVREKIKGRPPGHTHITKAMRAEIADLIRGGATHDEIHARYGIVRRTIHQIRMEAGIDAGWVPYTPEEDEKLKRLFAEGLDRSAIVAQLPGRTHSSVSGRAAKLGIAFAPPISRDPAVVDRVRALAQSGLSQTRIVAETGYHRKTIRRILVENGITAPKERPAPRPRSDKPKRPPKPRVRKAEPVAPQQPLFEGWHIILGWWRSNAPPSKAAKWPELSEVNDLRRKMGRRPYLPMQGNLAPGRRIMMVAS